MLYLANWCTPSATEDDLGNEYDMACPIGIVLADRSAKTITAMLELALEESLGYLREPDSPPFVGQWATQGWKPATAPQVKGTQTWEWTPTHDDNDETPWEAVVVQVREAFVITKGEGR